MSSIKVNTIQGIGSNSGANAKLSSDSTYISEGGGVTDVTLVQGLAKVWADINAGQGGYGDSFGTSSISDDATGEATMSHTTNMSSASYSATTSVTFDQDGTNGHRDTLIRTKATSSTRVEFIYADTSGRGNQLDLEVDASVTIHGDLA